jgi:hypothetical protein
MFWLIAILLVLAGPAGAIDDQAEAYVCRNQAGQVIFAASTNEECPEVLRLDDPDFAAYRTRSLTAADVAQIDDILIGIFAVRRGTTQAVIRAELRERRERE